LGRPYYLSGGNNFQKIKERNKEQISGIIPLQIETLKTGITYQLKL